MRRASWRMALSGVAIGVGGGFWGASPSRTAAPVRHDIVVEAIPVPNQTVEAHMPPSTSRVRADDNVTARIRALRTLRAVPSLAPVPRGQVTSQYAAGRYHPIRRRVQPHYGVDIAAPAGTPIVAAADGIVAVSASSATYGLGLDIDHGNGYVTRYAHASRLLVGRGTRVSRGDTIALVGSTGLSTGPHLHYEVFRDGWSVDPKAHLVEPSSRRTSRSRPISSR